MSALEPWVLVNAGFHELGGQSKANAALADFLLERGHVIHLVAHEIDAKYHVHPNVRLHPVQRPMNADILGWLPLDWQGRAVASTVRHEDPRARVVVNGGSCLSDDINWVHCVHHAWLCCDAGAPTWFRLKNRAFKWWARRRERLAIPKARTVVANSANTKDQLLDYLGIPADRVHAVALGSDPAWVPATDAERQAERVRLELRRDVPVVFFIGALSHDRNKGFDTLLAAWKQLAESGSWDADLVVIGGGSGVAMWQERIVQAGLPGRIVFGGFTNRVMEMLAAADLLVSPARYEAYGLNVQEAVCRGVPALVSSKAGVAAQYSSDLSEMILPDPENAVDLAQRLRSWRGQVEPWRKRFEPLAQAMRAHSWRAMAADIVGLAEGEPVERTG